MKSKSFELHKKTAEKVNQNKTFDFINFYKPASETNVKFVEKRKSDDGISKENESQATNAQISRRERSPYKKKKKVKSGTSLNISRINVEDISVPNTSGILNNSKVTSTPNVNDKKNKNVKSIMKNKSVINKSLNASIITVPKTTPKKRNKSVSFMLEETDEVVVKKSKSSDSFKNSKVLEAKDLIKIHKKKSKTNNFNSENDKGISDNAKNKTNETQPDETNDISTSQNQDKEKKKHKKHKKAMPTKTDQEVTLAKQKVDSINNNISDRKVKKLKSRRQKSKSVDTETINEQELKPEIIAQDLQNLNIGDNPHTLTNMLDEMTVVDKNKRKKHKKSFKKDHPKEVKSSNKTEAADVETKDEKEKVKWIKRKWNKDKKGLLNDVNLLTYIIIENLPLKIMCNYKKVLTEHFAKFGLVKQVGIAELYSMEDPEVFTTTICFDSEDAVEKALEEDNTVFEGNRIQIKRPMPPTQTTLVVRCFANITESALSSMFAGAGRIRNVRQLIKGKKSMCTAFIEFDGPAAVERAIKLAEGVTVERKKIFASRYEVRNKHKKIKTEGNDDNASDGSED